MRKIQSMRSATDDAPYVVQYRSYDPQLPQVFQVVERLVHTVAASISVFHIGSSSIPGIGGRNVLDIAISAAEAQHIEITRALKDLGFEESPFPHYLPLLVGQITFGGLEYPILLYVVSPESTVLADWLKFRDYMRTHPEDAAAYDATKQEAIANGNAAGEDYQEAKNPFLAAISAKLSVEGR